MPTTRKTTAKRATPRKPAAQPVTEAQKQAKLDAYQTLKGAGLAVPQELADEVEGWVEELKVSRSAEEQAHAAEVKKVEAEIAKENKAGPWYVRNMYPGPFNLRLDRQQGEHLRRIQLQPRGVPGDMHPIKDEDLTDPVLKRNLGTGLIEIIPAGEASLIIEKQTTNMSQRVHTPLAILRNERGEEYKTGVRTEAEFNSQGVVVAQLDPNQMQGRVDDKRVRVTRVNQGQQPIVTSGFVPTGGNPAIVTSGFDPQAREKAIDELARRRGGSGPGAGLGDVTVTVEPVRRT